jgi:hypothetical protein
MTRTRLPLIAAGAVLAVLLGALLLTGEGLPAPPDDPRVGPVLDADDRAALDTPPVLRGADPAPPDLVPTDPEAVVRAYLGAALSATADDAGRTQRGGTAYAEPGSPPAAVGVLVLDPPPPGQTRTATARSLDLVAVAPGDGRRGYRADVETRTGPPGGAVTTATTTRSVVVARQPDGRWLVTADGPENPDLVIGED